MVLLVSASLPDGEGHLALLAYCGTELQAVTLPTWLLLVAGNLAMSSRDPTVPVILDKCEAVMPVTMVV